MERVIVNVVTQMPMVEPQADIGKVTPVLKAPATVEATEEPDG